jgi:hypothetical protein
VDFVARVSMHLSYFFQCLRSTTIFSMAFSSQQAGFFPCRVCPELGWLLGGHKAQKQGSVLISFPQRSLSTFRSSPESLEK